MVVTLKELRDSAQMDDGPYEAVVAFQSQLKRAIETAVAAERERCAKIAEAYVADYDDDDEGSIRPVGTNIAAAIRKSE